MRSRTRFGLISSAVVFFLLGVAALVATVLRTFDSLSGGVGLDGTYTPPGQLTQVLTTLMPASAALFFVLSVVCAAGAVASYVVTEGVERAAALRAAAPSAASQRDVAQAPAAEILESHPPA